ncbi:MAG: hypothetical protein WBP13_02025 [Methylophilaceae bacterium]
MKLTIDLVLSPSLANMPSSSALSKLLAKGQLTYIDLPLEAYTSSQFGLTATPDFSIAAIAAAADGLTVGVEYWLRADPVHLMMQRDSVSLSAPVPLPISTPQATALLASLNAHFQQDGLNFLMGNSGAWYCRLAHAPQMKTILPSEAIDKNMFNFLPQGQDASRWLAIMNEVQMLLFSHPINAEREAQQQNVVNSVWFSGGGVLPAGKAVQSGLNLGISLMVGSNPLYQGLAYWTGIPYQAVVSQLDAILQLQENHVWMQHSALDDAWFDALILALKAKKIKQLCLNIGYFEKTLALTLQPIKLYQFWRKPKAVVEYFND